MPLSSSAFRWSFQIIANHDLDKVLTSSLLDVDMVSVHCFKYARMSFICATFCYWSISGTKMIPLPRFFIYDKTAIVPCMTHKTLFGLDYKSCHPECNCMRSALIQRKNVWLNWWWYCPITTGTSSAMFDPSNLPVPIPCIVFIVQLLACWQTLVLNITTNIESTSMNNTTEMLLQ